LQHEFKITPIDHNQISVLKKRGVVLREIIKWVAKGFIFKLDYAIHDIFSHTTTVFS
jgi:Fe-S cluster assembly scaffold protein SufB